MKNILSKTIGILFLSTFSHVSMAALIDFTDTNFIGGLTSVSNGFEGNIDGIVFTLTSTDGTVNFKENYAGNSTGCSILECDKDGAGINNDEISGGVNVTQTMTLLFDTEVAISSFYFLDLYKRPDYDTSNRAEQATITIDDVLFETVLATGLSGDGGFASLENVLAIGTKFEFTAAIDPLFWDDRDNDYALAGVEVSAVPLPAAVWLFGSVIAGFAGFSRYKKKA